MQKYNNERKVSTGNRVVRKMTKLHPCQNSLKFWLATMLRDNQENGQISDIDEQWTNNLLPSLSRKSSNKHCAMDLEGCEKRSNKRRGLTREALRCRAH